MNDKDTNRVAKWEIEVPLEDGESVEDVWEEVMGAFQGATEDLDREIKVIQRA